MVIKGIYYKSPFVYRLITRLKLGLSYDTRYKIALEYVKSCDCVLEICGADGEFREYLPETCRYECVECGPRFILRLKKKNIRYFNINLHNGIDKSDFKADVIVMINSLYQFKNTSAHDLLEEYKKIAKQIIIVEDVCGSMWQNTIIQRLINYLHNTDYHTQGALFSADEFKQVITEHGYSFRMHDKRYAVAWYNFNM